MMLLFEQRWIACLLCQLSLKLLLEGRVETLLQEQIQDHKNKKPLKDEVPFVFDEVGWVKLPPGTKDVPETSDQGNNGIRNA